MKIMFYGQPDNTGPNLHFSYACPMHHHDLLQRNKAHTHELDNALSQKVVMNFSE